MANSPARQLLNGRGALSGHACLAPAARWVRPGRHSRGGAARDQAAGGRTASGGRADAGPTGGQPPLRKRARAGVAVIVVLPGRNVCPICPSGEPGLGCPVRVAAHGQTRAQSQVEAAPPPADPATARRRPAVCRSRVAVAGMRALLGRRPPRRALITAGLCAKHYGAGLLIAPPRRVRCGCLVGEVGAQIAMRNDWIPLRCR
jgi:hypothetical protein